MKWFFNIHTFQTDILERGKWGCWWRFESESRLSRNWKHFVYEFRIDSLCWTLLYTQYLFLLRRTSLASESIEWNRHFCMAEMRKTVDNDFCRSRRFNIRVFLSLTEKSKCFWCTVPPHAAQFNWHEHVKLKWIPMRTSKRSESETRHPAECMVLAGWSLKCDSERQQSWRILMKRRRPVAKTHRQSN